MNGSSGAVDTVVQAAPSGAGDLPHDPLCPEPECIRACAGFCDDVYHYCQCDLIAKVRADEREQAAQRIIAADLHERWCYLARPYPGDPAGSCDCFHTDCLAAVRGETQ